MPTLRMSQIGRPSGAIPVVHSIVRNLFNVGRHLWMRGPVCRQRLSESRWHSGAWRGGRPRVWLPATLRRVRGQADRLQAVVGWTVNCFGVGLRLYLCAAVVPDVMTSCLRRDYRELLKLKSEAGPCNSSMKQR